MLSLLVGTVGGGKSYEAVVYHVLPALRSGRKVITNLPLNISEFRCIDATYPDLIEIRQPTADNPIPFSRIEDYGSPWRHPENGCGALYVIDECHIPLPFKETPRSIEDWISLHRHSASDMVLITQSYQKMSKSIRDLCQNLYKVRKNVAFGSFAASKSYTRAVYDGVGSRAALIERSQRLYKPQFFKLYQSHTQGGGKELNFVAFKSIWHHWVFKALSLFVVLSIYMVSGVDWTHNPFNYKSYGQKSFVASKSSVNTVSGSPVLPPAIQNPRQNYTAISSADYYGTGDYPYHGTRFIIRGKVSAHKATSYLIEALAWSPPASSLPDKPITDKLKDAVAPSPAAHPAPVVRHFVSLDALELAGYTVQILDNCNIKLSYTQNGHSENNFISCAYPQ